MVFLKEFDKNAWTNFQGGKELIYKFLNQIKFCSRDIHTSKLKANLNFWKISIKSSAGGGLALIVSIPSVKKNITNINTLFISIIPQDKQNI